MSGDWRDAGSCRDADAGLFFGPDGERETARAAREKKAAAICAGCPVQPECREFAISRPVKYGYWGGLNEDERARERRRRLRARKAEAA